MMFKNDFVVAVKHNNKVLREYKDTVFIPFGSEYSVFLKNLRTVRALAKVWADGQLITEGVELVVPANGSIDLERFIRDGNLEAGNRLKFIERSAAVEEHRGIEAEDGLVRVEFRFEQTYPQISWSHTYDSVPTRTGRYGGCSTKGLVDTSWMNRTIGTNGTFTSSVATKSFGAPLTEYASDSINCSNTSDSTFLCSTNEVGITAEGSVSDQAFTRGSWFATETESHSIVLKLLGKTKDNEPVEAPITVKTVVKCKTCGTKAKGKGRFCAECGTSLQIV